MGRDLSFEEASSCIEAYEVFEGYQESSSRARVIGNRNRRRISLNIWDPMTCPNEERGYSILKIFKTLLGYQIEVEDLGREKTMVKGFDDVKTELNYLKKEYNLENISDESESEEELELALKIEEVEDDIFYKAVPDASEEDMPRRNMEREWPISDEQLSNIN